MRRFRRRPALVGRRWLRRLWRRGDPAMALPRPVVRRLRRAHALLQAGEYAQAAEAFEPIAEEAGTLGLPLAAPLSVEAGVAWILAGELDRGLTSAERGLDWLHEGEAGPRVAILRGRVVEALRKTGHTTEATALVQKYAGGPSLPTASARGRLPASCPQCGGRVRPDEVEWVDASTAVCDYCGSILRAEQG